MTNENHLEQIILLLQYLDQLLENAIKEAEIVYGTDEATNPYRGIQIDTAEIEQLLDRTPGAPVLLISKSQKLPSDIVTKDPPLGWLQENFGLSAFDIDVIAIALAPELDRRYERLYAYLQDDVRCKRPTVDLALNLLCPSAIDKIKRRVHFAPESPLIYHNLLHLVLNVEIAQPTLLAHALKLDEQVITFILGQKQLDSRLIQFCELVEPKISFDDLPLNQDIKQPLETLVVQSRQISKPLKLYFQGEDKIIKLQTAEALAKSLQTSLLIVNFKQVLEAKIEVNKTIQLLFSQALFTNTLLYLEGIEALQETEIYSYEFLLNQIYKYPNIIILSSLRSWVNNSTKPIGILTILFPVPDFAQRKIYWQKYLTNTGFFLEEKEINILSDRFRLNSHQIAEAVATVSNQANWQTAKINVNSKDFQVANLSIAARSQSQHNLTSLARKIKPIYTWDDLILPAYQKTLLQEICNQVKYYHLVWNEWGFKNKLSLGHGLSVMFSGVPGTGKTMAAEIIASELQLDLYKIDLAQIVSKYIGETEKNLDRIFIAATNANAILLFDEADTIFGKRTEVKDAHDRYANLEVGYLLQKMEEYDGLAILTTNLRSNMDDAFTRRLRFIIDFPFPNEKQRRQIWQKIFPQNAPCSSELDLNFLAQKLEITGAEIRNIALNAAFLAADEGKEIKMTHLLQAVQCEYQKMGKLFKQDFA